MIDLAILPIWVSQFVSSISKYFVQWTTFLLVPTLLDLKYSLRSTTALALFWCLKECKHLWNFVTMSCKLFLPFHNKDGKSKRLLPISSCAFLSTSHYSFLSQLVGWRFFIECTDVVNSLNKTNDRLSVAITKAEFSVLRTACSVSSLFYDPYVSRSDNYLFGLLVEGLLLILILITGQARLAVY